MSDLGLELGHEKRHRPRRGLGCLAVLVALAVLAGGGYLAYSYGLSALKEKLAGPADYTGSGTGQVLVQVRDGEDGSGTEQSHERKRTAPGTVAFTGRAVAVRAP